MKLVKIIREIIFILNLLEFREIRENTFINLYLINYFFSLDVDNLSDISKIHSYYITNAAKELNYIYRNITNKEIEDLLFWDIAHLQKVTYLMMNILK